MAKGGPEIATDVNCRSRATYALKSKGCAATDKDRTRADSRHGDHAALRGVDVTRYDVKRS